MVFSDERRKVLARLGHWIAAFWLASSTRLNWASARDKTYYHGAVIKLPRPKTDGPVSVEQAIKRRRTTRTYRPKSISMVQLSQLLWSAQGITETSGYKRAAPSAGALYPMDVYTVTGNESVAQIEAGVYHYVAEEHLLSQITGHDLRDRIARSALSQMWMAKAPINFVITAEYSRATSKYGKRSVRYAMIEAGHIGQNLFLQAEALGLKAGIVGAFHDKDIIRVMKIPREHEPLLIMPVGYAV